DPLQARAGKTLDVPFPGRANLPAACRREEYLLQKAIAVEAVPGNQLHVVHPEGGIQRVAEDRRVELEPGAFVENVAIGRPAEPVVLDLPHFAALEIGRAPVEAPVVNIGSDADLQHDLYR